MPTVEPSFNNDQHPPSFFWRELMYLATPKKRTLTAADRFFLRKAQSRLYCFDANELKKTKNAGVTFQVSGAGERLAGEAETGRRGDLGI
jgi:hypothetical protein